MNFFSKKKCNSLILSTLLFPFFISICFAAQFSEIIEIKSRPGVTQKFFLINPDNAVACVILFAGGDGDIGLSSFLGKPSINNMKNNFLIRSKSKFAKNGLLTAVMDKPSDRKNLKGFRGTEQHAEDIRSVANYLKKKTGLPVWLIGTSAGTFSATHAAINLNEEIDGLVLSATITRLPKKYSKTFPNGVLSMTIDKIKIPTLIVHHEKDGCRTCPPSNAIKFKKALVNCPKVEVKMFNGGFAPQSGPCSGRSNHGFYGIEDEVISEISSFINSNSM